MPAVTVLKLGGELVEASSQLAILANAIAQLARRGPLVVIHGGGREIDAESARRGLTKQAVDGLRITDPDTLDVVVAVLAGTINTRLVSILVAAGVPAVGLSGADAMCVPVVKARPHVSRDGTLTDLGLVGEPRFVGPPALVEHLLEAEFVPVIACLGSTASGEICNVNADTLASSLAVVMEASALVIAGATRGVLDGQGKTIDVLDTRAADAIVADGTASAGMVAKLAACRRAAEAGVASVTIVDGRDRDALTDVRGTRVIAGRASSASGVHS